MRSVLTILVFSVVSAAFAADDPASVLARILAERGAITSSDLARVEAADGRDGVNVLASRESVLPVGTPGQNGVRSLGGWSQLQFNLNPKWQVNVAYGIDTEKNRQLRTGDRNKNQTYTGNVIYKYSPHVNFAWEWRRFLTSWKNQQSANENGDHVNLGIAYIF